MILLILAAARAEEPPLPAWHPVPLLPPGMEIHANPRIGFHGYRLQVPAGPASVSARVALVADLDGPLIGELTLSPGRGSGWPPRPLQWAA